MDEDKIKKKLLVVGDSFMKPDSCRLQFVGQHWSEMITDYEIINLAEDSSTNAVITVQLMEGLEQHPDAVVLGFTMPDRIEFANNNNYSSPRRWYSNGMIPNQLSDQRLAVDYYRATVCPEMLNIKGYTMARCCFLTLKNLNIPYAYSLNGLDNNLADLNPNPWLTKFLGDFKEHQIPLNLATYPDFKMIPGYHVDNAEWQATFAKQALEIIQRG
jgi:hypothetical protein